MTSNGVVGIPLRIVEPFPPYGERQPGMMWRYTTGDRDGRECWWIMLPPHPDIGTPGHPGELSWRTTDTAHDGDLERMWDVAGTPPALTVTPSIDVVRYVLHDGKHVRDGSYWHGWIRDGMLVDA